MISDINYQSFLLLPLKLETIEKELAKVDQELGKHAFQGESGDHLSGEEDSQTHVLPLYSHLNDLYYHHKRQLKELTEKSKAMEAKNSEIVEELLEVSVGKFINGGIYQVILEKIACGFQTT